jgi:predicted lipoprotein with Yx(FWY)xxD motif
MKKLLSLGAVVAASAALAACGGGGDEGDSATAAAPNTSGQTVSVEEIGDAGPVLVDSSGQALYTSDEETAAGRVLCTDACESFWIPLTADEGAPSGGPVADDLGVVQRPDGSRQVTYEGVPLYSFSEDGPGEVTGDGFADAFDGQPFTWHVATVSEGAPSAAPSGGGALGY